MSNQIQEIPRVPPITARVGQACQKCFKGIEEGVALKICTTCRRVRYCSTECQKADWKSHKSICKALHAAETDPALYQTIAGLFDVPSGSTPDVTAADTVAQQSAFAELHAVQLLKGKPFNVIEQNIIGWQPRCLACARTDSILRMEARSKGTEPATLSHCSDCHLAFYCSTDHWNLVRDFHSQRPDEDGYADLPQCALNRQIRLDTLFKTSLPEQGDSGFQWVPERVKEQWTPLLAEDWGSEFGDHLRQALHLETQEQVQKSLSYGPMLRSATEGLSMPMSILYALENLNPDDAWTKKSALTVHVLGPTFDRELAGAMAFEELLHQLPNVKTLEITFCGPEMPGGSSDRWLEMETCPKCRRSNRRRKQRIIQRAYHDYARRAGSAFQKPDLAVAFNSGCSQEEVDSWTPTIKFLVDAHIPTVFTAFNREEGQAEAKLFADLGAALVPTLGPRVNPWGSLVLQKEANRVTGFYAVNGWLACGCKYYFDP
ncbi:hypothetical protein PENSPDRAFT_742311 [Peniophora sp. CONT]|nr:hypothetical protein PENSPDRAFT_742311 [Peniophora sp. CONT]